VASNLSRFERIGKAVGAVENVNADTGNRLRLTEFGRALQLRIRNRADDDEVLGERKRKGFGNATRHVDSLRRLRCPGRRGKNRAGRERKIQTFGSALRPV
jgi:hypothetical protein